MKKALILLTALSLPAFAGTGKEVVAEPEPSDSAWFAGASIGYLFEFEEPMYHLHLGQDTGKQIGGWDLSWFLEIGYTEKDEAGGGSAPGTLPASYDLDSLEAAIAGTAGAFDLEVMPITINSKFEKALNEDFTAYVGAGVGFANIDLSVTGVTTPVSDDDWVLTAQIFAGVIYDINTDWELYGGGRWMYFDEADIGATTLDLDDDFLLELGVRYNF